MTRLESNRTEQSWFCCPIHFTGVNCRSRLDFVQMVDDSIHVDQVYRKQYIRNIAKILLSRGRHVHLKTYKQKTTTTTTTTTKTVWMRLPMLREIFLGIFNRPPSCKGPEYQRLFLFQSNSASGDALQFRSI